MEEATVGEQLAEDGDVDINHASREPGIIEPHDINAVTKHEISHVMEKLLHATVDVVASSVQATLYAPGHDVALSQCLGC